MRTSTRALFESLAKLYKQGQLHTVRLELENLLSDRKVELADIETVKSCVEDLKNTLDDTSITERKSFIKSFVKEVRVAASEGSLDYKPSFLKGMMPRETLLVPPIVHYGGAGGTRTLDLLTASLQVCLFPVVFEAKLLFCAYPYFEAKKLYFMFDYKRIIAILLPFFSYDLENTVSKNSALV